MPRWMPATFDGKEIEKIARLRIELKTYDNDIAVLSFYICNVIGSFIS